MNTQIPKDGETIEIKAHGATLVVKKLHRDYFCVVRGKQIGRFGNAAEMRADIACFISSGILPVSTSAWA